jgi:hypothetical protein
LDKIEAWLRWLLARSASCTNIKVKTLPEREGSGNSIELYKNGVATKKSLPKNLSKVQRISEERCLLKLSLEEGEALMKEGRVIVMAFSDFTGRLCERIRFRYDPPREIEANEEC